MAPPARILVPAEPRHGNAQAVAYGAALATALDAELLLLGLVALPTLGPLAVPPEPDGIADFEPPEDPVVRRQLARTRAHLRRVSRARALLGWGPPGPAIVDAAREQAADLVVVPNGKRGGFPHLLHSSTARYVVQHCAVPILVVPAADVAPPRPPDVHPLLDALAAGGTPVAEDTTGDDDVVVLHWPRRGAQGHLLPHHAAWHALKRSPLPVLVVPAGNGR